MPRRWVRDEIVAKRVRAEHDDRVNTQTAHNAPTCTFDPERHVYTIGDIEVPSVTQVLTEERFIDFTGIPDRTLDAAQARGTYVHQCLHFLLEGDFDVDDCRPEYRGYVDSALAYLEALHKRPFFQTDGKPTVEYRFWHTRRMFAGTMDYLGWDADDVLSIDEFKTGEPSDVGAPLQTAAYELGVRECLLPTLTPNYTKHIRRRAVKLYRDGRPAKAEPYFDPRDLQMFLTALNCVQFRRNHMRHPE